MTLDQRWLEQHSGPAASVRTEAPCFICGYNLIGLPRSAVCPECGTQIAKSVGPRQTRTLQALPRNQQRALCVGALAAGFAVIPMAVLLVIFPAVTGKLSHPAHIVMSMLALVSSIAWAGGVFLIAVRLPGEGPANRVAGFGLPIGFDQLAQWSQAAWVLITAILIAFPLIPTGPLLLVRAILVGLVAIGSAGVFFVCLRIMRLSIDIFDDRLNDRLLWVTWGLAPCLLSAVLFKLAAPVLGAISQMISLIAIIISGILIATLTHALVDLGQTIGWAAVNSEIDEERDQRRAARKAREDSDRLKPLALTTPAALMRPPRKLADGPEDSPLPLAQEPPEGTPGWIATHPPSPADRQRAPRQQ